MKKNSGCYSATVLMVSNTIVILFTLNLVLGLIIYPIIDAVRGKGNDNTDSAPGILQYGEDLLAQAYPDWDRDELRAMLTELWSRPFMCAPYVHYRSGPYQGEYVNIHPVGFRYISEEQVWPPVDDIYTVFVFGGSTTYGFGVPDNQTIPAYLSAELNAIDSVAVYNFGQGTYFSTQEMLLLQSLLQQGYQPDLVILIDGLNDSNSHGQLEIPARWDTTCGQKETSSNEVSVMQALAPIELPVDRLLTSIRYRFGLNTTEENVEPIASYVTEALSLEESVELYRRNVRMVEGLGLAYDFETRFVIQPVPMYEYNLDNHIFWYWETDLRDSQKYYEILAERYADEQWENTLWLADIQAEREELLYVDRVHYTAAFNQEIAALIADYVQTTIWP